MKDYAKYVKYCDAFGVRPRAEEDWDGSFPSLSPSRKSASQNVTDEPIKEIRPNNYREPKPFFTRFLKRLAVSSLKGLGYVLLAVIAIILLLAFWSPPAAGLGTTVVLILALWYIFHDNDKARKEQVDRLIKKLDEKL